MIAKEWANNLKTGDKVTVSKQGYRRRIATIDSADKKGLVVVTLEHGTHYFSHVGNKLKDDRGFQLTPYDRKLDHPLRILHTEDVRGV